MKLYLVLVISVCQMWSVTAVGCDTVYPGVPTFKNCTYRCHCMDDAACDETTGECSNGCAPGWAGPACQYRDATFGYTAVNHAGSSTLVADGPGRAVDGDINTCSKSAPQPGQYDYWFIELNRQYLINGLSITVPVDFLDSFNQFNINLSLDGVNYDSNCYRHNQQHVNKTLDVACTNITLAKFVKIVLQIPNTAIRLCDVTVFSGRELAFNKHSVASSIYFSFVKEMSAVNGIAYGAGMFWDVCFMSGLEKTTLWRLDIDSKHLIHDIYYMGRSDCCIDNQMRGFQIQISNSSSGPWQTVYRDTYTGNQNSFYALRATELRLAYEASLIQLVRERTVAEPFAICEVQVFGECPDGLCGWTCNDTCQCNVPPTGLHRIRGTCPTGCKERYVGVTNAQRCDIECDENHWGPGCTNTCGNCNTESCDALTGSCKGGCSGPWKPPLCNESCDAGLFGINCSQACGHCKDNAACNPITGLCPHDVCKDGWVFGICKEKCMKGRFGRNCVEQCGQCSGNTTCFHVDGNCNTSCKPGFIGRACLTGCTDGQYGFNCSLKCGRCIHGHQCNKVNGYCENGCQPGYNGTLCQSACPNGTYGLSCSNKCGVCANCKPCNHVTGACTDGCLAGYEGALCQALVAQAHGQRDDSKSGFALGIGVGVGATIVMLAVVGVTMYICVRLKKSRTKQKTDSNYETTNREGMDVAHVYDSL